MPRFYFAREIGSEGDNHLHRIAAPSYGEPGWYRTVTSANAFRSGHQKGLTEAQRASHRTSCGWNHAKGILYSLKRDDDHHQDMAGMLESAEFAAPEVGAKLRAMYDAVPVIDHASLFDFYDYIGFDRKKRRYTREAKA